ncbi:MAG: hypothetical protein V4696_13105 [Pseudomonadota bacterium]
MPANTAPIYTLTPDTTTDNSTGMPQGKTAAAADYDGTGANNFLMHTAGANGSYVRTVVAKAKGTNVATVLRIYVNNGATNGTASNNGFVAEISLPATTASATAGTPEIEFPMEFALKAAHRLYGGLGTAVAAGWVFTVIGGQY